MVDSKGVPITVGATVRVVSYWPPALPLHLVRSHAKVLKLGRTRVVIKSDGDVYGTRTVPPNCLRVV